MKKTIAFAVIFIILTLILGLNRGVLATSTEIQPRTTNMEESIENAASKTSTITNELLYGTKLPENEEQGAALNNNTDSVQEENNKGGVVAVVVTITIVLLAILVIWYYKTNY